MHSILSDSISGFGEGHGGTAAGQKGNKRYEAEWQRPTSELPSSPLTPHFCWLSSEKRFDFRSRSSRAYRLPMKQQISPILFGTKANRHDSI